jgi:transcriptional regulator with XRE-family HTH domain
MIIGASTSRAARGLLDWTQAQLASAAQVSLSTVKNFEAGRSLPSPENLRAMQRALEAATVEFLPGGAVRLWPDPITFGRDYLVDRDRFRLIACRHGRDIIVDISREALDDFARLSGASLAQRHAHFDAQRAEFEACAEDLLRSQAPGIERVMIDAKSLQEWRRHRGRLLAQDR